MKFNEQYTVENYILKYLEEMLGYEYIKPEVFLSFREYENEYVIKPLLIESIQKINGVDEETAKKVFHEVKKLDTNEDFLNVMKNGINLKDSETGKNKDYNLVDFENVDNNHFVVTNQFYFEGDAENIRPDIMVFLNGLPICDIEAKSPTASASVNYENAIGQIKRYETVARKMFLPNCFNIATDGLKTEYGPTYSPKQYYSIWREEKEESNDEGLEETLGGLLEKNNLLDIIKNFLIFEKKKESVIKMMGRYQQKRTANKILQRVLEGKSKRGLVWHTQGSGKSLTMFFTAWKLRFDKNLNNPKIFVLVDRIDLDDQLYETFIACGGENVYKVTSRKDLEKRIKSPEHGIFISTMQKISELGRGVEDLSDNIIVLSDEAHREDEGKAGMLLRKSMKNAFFFGFTGTPIDKTITNTFRNYGAEGERYLDYYSIQQAIDDGATLPVTYEARLSKIFIDEEKIDEQFEEIAGDLKEEEKELLKQKHGKKSVIVKMEKRMRMIAQDIVEHYKSHVMPNGFKAQIVGLDREAVAKYKKLLDELVPEEWSAVIYSPGDPNMDADELRLYNTSKQEREQLIANFKDKNHPIKFLIVCDMLLTGFDAPVEQVMYLDKPLRDHNLLQAIARTNRVYPNKGCGKIIDYYGITRNLYKALDFDESIVDSAMIDIEQMKESFKKTIAGLTSFFPNINIEDPSIDNLRKCLKLFIDEESKQQDFKDKYGELKILYEILSPDPFLVDYIRQFEWLTSFYIAFNKKFSDEDDIDRSILEEYGEKVKKLIQERVEYEGITKNFRELKVSDIYNLQKLEDMDEDEKALNLERLLKREISIALDINPIFRSFSERLQVIRQEFEQHQMDLTERIKQYYNLIGDIKKEDKEAKDLGFDTMQERGLYYISREFIDKDVGEEIIKDFVFSIKKMTNSILDEGWQESAKRDDFIKGIKRQLQILILKEYKGKIKINDFHKYLNRLEDIIIKKF